MCDTGSWGLPSRNLGEGEIGGGKSVLGAELVLPCLGKWVPNVSPYLAQKGLGLKCDMVEAEQNASGETEISRPLKLRERGRLGCVECDSGDVCSSDMEAVNRFQIGGCDN